MRYKWGTVYFVILGAAAVYLGGLQFVGALGVKVEKLWFIKAIGVLDVLFRRLAYMNLWEGLVVFLAGWLIIWGAFKLRSTSGLGEVIIGSIMIWLAGVGDFLKMLFAAFGDPFMGKAFNIFSFDFLRGIGPPYSIATWLIPFSLVVIYFIVKHGEAQDGQRRQHER
jgi:hypothetical protein